MNEALSASTGESKVRQYQSDTLTISGLEQPLGLDAAALAGCADVVGGPATIHCYSGRHVREVRHWRGVRVTRLLDLAGMQALPIGRRKQSVIAVVAKDGYRCLFTWHELYNTAVGSGVILVVEEDGVAFDPDLGGLHLVSLRDLRLGPRQALAVSGIEVRQWQA